MRGGGVGGGMKNEFFKKVKNISKIIFKFEILLKNNFFSIFFMGMTWVGVA